MTITEQRLEGAIHYADSRAQATGYRYMVTDMGHALIDCPHNRRAVEQMGCTVIYLAKRNI